MVVKKRLFWFYGLKIALKKCLKTRGEFKKPKLFWFGYLRQDVSLRWCKGSKSLFCGRFGYPYSRPGDSSCMQETPGLSRRVGMNANIRYPAIKDLMLSHPRTCHPYFQSMLVCLQIEESSFGLFFVNCTLYMFAYSWSFYSNCTCLIDYKSWLIWMPFLLCFKGALSRYLATL